MWNLKIQYKWTFLQNRNWLRDPENRTVVSKGEREGRGMDWEFGVGKCKLLHLEWINKVLQYRTGNYIQNYVINHKKSSHSVMSDFLWPHRLYSPWNSLGQNTGVVSLSLLQGIFPIQVSRIAGRFFTSCATREPQEYWNGEPIPSPVDLPSTGIKPVFPTLQVDSLPAELPGKPHDKP